MAVRGRGNGDQRRYFNEVVCRYQGEDCLVWPFTRMKNGYAVLNKKVVSRMACQHLHGPPEIQSLDAAHSCGNGHLGCVNPRHVTWKTRKENMEDQLIHGNRNRGERQGLCKLTEDKIREIRALKNVMPMAKVGKMYGISTGHVCNIMNRKTWGWLDGRG